MTHCNPEIGYELVPLLCRNNASVRIISINPYAFVSLAWWVPVKLPYYSPLPKYAGNWYTMFTFAFTLGNCHLIRVAGNQWEFAVNSIGIMLIRTVELILVCAATSWFEIAIQYDRPFASMTNVRIIAGCI